MTTTIGEDLRALADHLDRNPELAEAFTGQIFNIYADDPDQFGRLVAQLGGARTKKVSDNFFTVQRRFGGIQIDLFTSREAVCTRRVVGTETVEVPDPDAPKVTVTRDIVEWDCEPVLGGVS
jgi:hypothetical protein